MNKGHQIHVSTVLSPLLLSTYFTCLYTVPDNENDGNDSDVMVISPPISRENVRNQPMPTSFTPDLSNLPRTFPSFAPIVRTSGQEDLSTASFGHRYVAPS